MPLVRLSIALLFCLTAVGCSSEPAIYPVTGTVTLGGKSYERLIVYFRPVKGKITDYNLGVGETDANGTLSLRSTSGAGIARGKYRVFFSCVTVEGAEGVPLEDKVDDNPNVVVRELVPELYANDENSPVEFEVSANKDNVFEFDIPSR